MSAARLLYLQSRTSWSKVKMPGEGLLRLAILYSHEASSRCTRVRVLLDGSISALGWPRICNSADSSRLKPKSTEFCLSYAGTLGRC